MKKVITFILLALMVSLTFVACNDGTEGLLSKAMTAKKEESHNLLYILGRSNDDKLLYVATNEGIYSYSGNGSFAYVEGTGISALNTLYFDGATKIVHRDNHYYKVNIASGTEDEIVSLDGMIFTDMYSPDGISFTYLFRDKNGDSVGFFAESRDGDKLFETRVSLPKNSSLVGNGGFAYTDGNSYFVSSIKNHTTTWEKRGTKQITGYVEANGINITTTSSNDYYYNEEFKDISSNSSSQPFVAISNDAKYIFFPKSSTYISTSDKGDIKPTTGGLDSISVLSAIRNKNNNNEYLLISRSNGAFILDTGAKTLNKISGISFSEYVF